MNSMLKIAIDNACTSKRTSYSLATIFHISKRSMESSYLLPSNILLDVSAVTHQNQSDAELYAQGGRFQCLQDLYTATAQ